MIQNDVVGVIHQTPSRMALSNEVSISREDLYRWISISDEFVGYRNIRSGLKSGLHYQSGPMNDARISSSRSIIMQSPKIVVSDRLDTQLLVFTPSSDKHNESVIPFHLVILDIDGFPVAETSVTLGMRQRALISVKQVLTEAGSLNQFIAKGGFGMMVGLAMNGNVIPLSLATDISGGLAIDHTLPPPYYVYRWNSEERKRTTHELVRKFFSHLVESQ